MYVLVDDVQVPVRVAGDPALEICNTLAGWDDPTPKEYLGTYAELVVWARENALVTPDEAVALQERATTSRRRAATVLRETRTFRAAFREVLLHPPAPDAWGVVTGTAERARRAQRLRWDGCRAHWVLDLPADDLRRPLLAAAAAAAHWLTGHEAGEAAACPGTGCGWVFADPARRRRWCSMAVCGNRAKARRHAARQRAS